MPLPSSCHALDMRKKKPRCSRTGLPIYGKAKIPVKSNGRTLAACVQR